VQEAAHEDANIIFGAVVDAELKGKVKITVIATGFESLPSSRLLSAPADTPVDMAVYAEQPRARVEAVASPSRLSIARRPAFDLPLVAATGASMPAPSVDVIGRIGDDVGEGDAHAAFDVPAFLRRQDG
jgi:cell division protein FtsZ